MADTPDTPPNRSGAGVSQSRLLANSFILAFLAFQVAMPLRYYLGDRGYDERFSWRMFSTLRLQQCSMQVAEAGENQPFRDVAVKRDLQVAWVNLLERVRMPVVEKYLARRCERPSTAKVSYTRRCTNTDGSALPVQTIVMDCGARTLRAEHGAGP
jgi:hypothetical protein